MQGFPVFLNLAERSAVVVGGGETAARKARLLSRANARIRLIAPRLNAELSDLAASGRVEWRSRGFVPADLDGAALAFGATELDDVDAEVSAAAQLRNVPVNVPDRPDLSSFSMPSIVDRDPITIAISSGGAAPVLVRSIRAKLEALLPAKLGELARFADRHRAEVKARLSGFDVRRRFWERFFDGPLARRVLAGEEVADSEMTREISRDQGDRPSGSVAIVGAGPGDPELLTFKALRHMQEADVIVHDKLIGPDILDYARRDAERIYVGKCRGRHAMRQEEINALLAARAEAGQRVVRLKGGDPFVFGRGGEEKDYLAARGVRTEVVAGITAATGCAAAAGIPLTHRDHASAVTFLTGHARADLDREPAHDWAALASGGQTLVFYMGLSQATIIARRLVKHGMAPATPVAIIENGTLPDQRIVCGAIAELDLLTADHDLKTPALIVVGTVVDPAAAARTAVGESVAA